LYRGEKRLFVGRGDPLPNGHSLANLTFSPILPETGGGHQGTIPTPVWVRLRRRC